jgi:hypothetical protein
MKETDLFSRIYSSSDEKLSSLVPQPLHANPQEVLRDSSLSIAEKRNLLSSWASDARAIPDAPALRQLDSGAVVNIRDILSALQILDGFEYSKPRRLNSKKPWRRRQSMGFLGWLPSEFRGRRTDDDDDPPPCPAVIAPLPGLPPFGAEAELEAA